jgi:DNA polymerase III epsilon subunit-like protein
MTLYLDTETTGLSVNAKIIEVGVVNDRGKVIFDSLINPQIPIPSEVTEIHGITDSMVLNAPTFAVIEEGLRNLLLADGTVVIYNADFDKRFFPSGFWDGLRVLCAMERYAIAAGRRRRLTAAAKAVGHAWTGKSHRAVADAQALRAVWQWMDARGVASPDRFANLDPNELVRQAWEAYLEAKEVAAELKQLKMALVAASDGQKKVFTVPGLCRVTVSARTDTTGRSTYRIDKDALALLDPGLRQKLFDLGVIRVSDKIGSTYHVIRFTDLRGANEIDSGEV